MNREQEMLSNAMGDDDDIEEEEEEEVEEEEEDVLNDSRADDGEDNHDNKMESSEICEEIEDGHESSHVDNADNEILADKVQEGAGAIVGGGGDGISSRSISENGLPKPVKQTGNSKV